MLHHVQTLSMENVMIRIVLQPVLRVKQDTLVEVVRDIFVNREHSQMELWVSMLNILMFFSLYIGGVCGCMVKVINFRQQTLLILVHNKCY